MGSLILMHGFFKGSTMTENNDILLGRYQIDQLIGGGAMGNVYLGNDLTTGEKVAIKRLRAEWSLNKPQLVERFLREGEALRRLNHPNIVKVLATHDEVNEHFIIMEYVEGGSLADLLTKESQLPVDLVISIGLELSDALSRAHHLHILHRDIKPANILLAKDGTPRLTDFGLARMGELPPLTESQSIIGTLCYLSPENFEGRETNERSDIWSFGVVLFEMLTGQLPFNGSNPFDIVWAVKNQSLPILENIRPEIPPALANLVRRMLRKDNPARVESVRQVGVELESIQKVLRSDHLMQNTSPVIRVLIVDDHAVVRQGLRTFIDLQEDMQVVGEGMNGREGVELAKILKPDIVLLDLVMPELDGVEAAEQIKTQSPDTRVLILTSFGEDDKIFPAINAGAQGYLLKDIPPDELIKAIRETYKGRVQLNPDMAKKLMAKFATKKNNPR
jgi:serine/threonine protein kinase